MSPSSQLAIGVLRVSAPKRLLALTAALGLVTGAAGIANANDLVNGNLDSFAVQTQNGLTPIGWIVEATLPGAGNHPDGCSSEEWCNIQAPGGRGLFFKPFQGSPDDPISVRFYQDVATTPGTKYTLSGYAAGEANYSGFFTTNTPLPATLFVVQFLDISSTVISSNAYDLVANGLPSGGPGSMTLFTTPQYTAPPGAVTVRAGASMLNTYSTSGGQSFFVDAFDLASEAPPGAPNITEQPVDQSVGAGATVTLNVELSNPAGVAYQWQFYQTNIVDGGNLSGTDTKTLTITGVTAANVGHYRVRLTGTGSVLSREAALAIVGINFYPVVTIEGKIGDTYRVDYATALAPANWIPLSTNLLTTSPQLVIDASSPGSNTRFYQAVYVPAP